MKLISFKAQKVHNRFKFDLNFKKGICLITGKNGRGKTTALKFISALIDPDLFWLLETNFKSAEIDLENNRKKVSIKAIKSDGVLTLSFSQDDELIASEEFDFNTRSRQSERHRFMASFGRKRPQVEEKSTSVLSLIEALPTPMYLSLLRKKGGISEDNTIRREYIEHSSSDSQSDLDVALKMIKNAVTKMELSHNKLTIELREDILVGDFDTHQNLEPIQHKFDDGFRTRITQFRESIVPAFKAIGIPDKKIQENVIPFFERSEEDAKIIGQENVEDLSKFNSMTENARGALVRLVGDMEKFRSMSLYQNLIRKFNEEKKKIFKERDKFLTILNLSLIHI